MPEVETASGVKRFPYNKKGKKKAKEYAKKSGEKVKFGIHSMKEK